MSKHWFSFYVFYTIMGVLCLLLFSAVVPESPKWLHMQARTEEAVTVLKQIAEFNGSTTPITFMEPKKDPKGRGQFLVMPSPAVTIHTTFSMLSAHSAYSEGAVEGIMRS